MGFKRTFDAEDVREHNVKHARQISFCNKLAKLDEGVPYRESLENSGEDPSDLYGFKCEYYVEKGFESNAPFSWTTTGFEEDSLSGATTQSTLSHGSPESDFPWRPIFPADDDDWCQMSPRKPVPIGSEYQADIPECVKEEVRGQSSDEEQVMGKCIIPMPDCETEVCKIGKGRKECICLDKGSIRCVQQHIMENREDLFETVGHERCLNIGLGERGGSCCKLVKTRRSISRDCLLQSGFTGPGFLETPEVCVSFTNHEGNCELLFQCLHPAETSCPESI
ncbi:hypothetical protein EUTSA_v10008408mg [Eutrema salsugineum]|uniref:ELM2 domain-containing protein n=1 Tax=Eutrema salsugineum TaxID=72664 RepID=V4MU50_EUTSA|nr:hypothetical protein EUTSA_v10008408mg [Eutrema salsugineum]